MIITCPNCSWSTQVPDDKAPPVSGKCMCPKCNTKFSILLEQEETKRCDFCGEKVLAIAKKCKHCGETIDIILRTAEEAKRSSKSTNVYMNAGGAAPAAAPVTKQNFPHGWHLLGTFLTGGLWAIIWILLYVSRDKNRYY